MDKTAPSYPKRQAYFAHRYCRLLTKTCAAQDIGHVAFCLCVTIAMLEDSKRYKGAITFYNGQLMPLVGVTKWDSLDNARRRAVGAGWLHYENDGKRRPGRYWATIPVGLDDIPDSPCDETPQALYPANGDNAGDNAGDKGGEPPYLTLTLKKEPAKAGDIPGGLLELVDGWNGLGQTIVKSGNGARRNPPAKAAIDGWKKAQKQAEQREALADIPAVLAAVRSAQFCHGQGWFTLPWLFGSNRNGEFNICRLLAGAHDGANGNGQPAKTPEPIKYRA